MANEHGNGSTKWVYDSLFIGGEWRGGNDEPAIEVLDPATEEIIGSAPGTSVAEARTAIAAARRAFDDGPWPSMTPAERGAAVLRLIDQLEARHDILHPMIVAEAGWLEAVVDGSQCAGILAYARWTAERAEHGPTWVEVAPPRATAAGLTGRALVREPVGVVAAITAFNAPFFLNIAKLVPALVAGCTVVLKPHPWTPLNGFEIAKAVADADLPPGVVNVITGGADVGEELTTNPMVDMIAFTGSTATGRRVMASASGSLKRLQLELGGKSAQVVLDDCSEAYAASLGFGSVLSHCGQICVNMSRLLLPQHLLDAYLAGVEVAKQKVKIGDPRDPSTTLGPLVSHEQRERVESFVQAGIAEGARLVTGGKRPEGIDRGYFYEPTVFVATNDMAIAREEIFGPVLTVIPYEGGDSEAVRIANDSPYGLGGGVFAATTARAFDAARRIRTGMVNAIGIADGPGAALPATPGQGPGWGLPASRSMLAGHHFVTGGFKQSGLGREMGDHGIEVYTELKAISWT